MSKFAQQHLISSIVPDPVTGAVEAAQLVDAFEHVDAMFFKRFGPKAAPPLSDTSDGGPQTQSAATMLESGTTAVVAIIHNDTHVLLAHVGDSRALLSHRGTAIPLTYDHKPTRADESARIELAGGRIEGYAVQRVMGRLAMTRAIGDPHLKQYGIVPTPDVHARVLTDHDNFLVLASDGLFDVVSNDEVVDAVQEHQSVDEAAETLVNLALSYGSRDDITVAVVRLRGWEAFCVPSSTTKGFIQVNTRNMTRPSS
ncbi:protein phosphatase 2C Ptc1 [Capsaspora owczarzaki ATCC 30864]|uniref:Protein phosphatase 2C Ptc1 n=1 Tax=Capsaspora owczarzaki (strain ATCC 30864) TaxID=595528 RepID=A0A0D2X475_CAPO3|nr:protein phosphatase 2C Ptc1 [Capsaspora owczarzaki ATCC 30864]